MIEDDDKTEKSKEEDAPQNKDKIPSVSNDAKGENGTSSKDKKIRVVTLRVSQEELDAIDRTCPKGERNQQLKKILLGEVEKIGGHIQEQPVTYEKLDSDATQFRRKMDSLKRTLNDKFEIISNTFESPLTPENIPALIQELQNYKVRPGEGFDKIDIYGFIEFLKAKQKLDELYKQMNSYEKSKPEAAETNEGKSPIESESKSSMPLKKRHIPKRDLCGCGRYEYKGEHNRRCFFTPSGMSGGVDTTNPNTGTPEGQLKMISNMGGHHATNADQKAMIIEYLKKHGTVAQKVMVNSTFYYQLFPPPFPDCDTYCYGKLVTEDLDCKEIRSFLLTPKQIKLADSQSNLKKRVHPRINPVVMVHSVMTEKDGWKNIDDDQKMILDAYLEKHGLPEPEYKGLGEGKPWRHYDMSWKARTPPAQLLEMTMQIIDDAEPHQHILELTKQMLKCSNLKEVEQINKDSETEPEKDKKTDPEEDEETDSTDSTESEDDS